MSHKSGNDDTHQYKPASGAYCLDCKYNLRGVQTHACPECGRPFDPEDRKTFKPRLDTWIGKLGGICVAYDPVEKFVGHLPGSLQKEIIKSARLSKSFKWIIIQMLAILTAVVGLGIVRSWILNKLLQQSTYLTYTLTGLTYFLLLYMMYLYRQRGRIYGEELHRRNIRPAYCFKCNYNLAGFDVTHCPKCKTHLLTKEPADTA